MTVRRIDRTGLVAGLLFVGTAVLLLLLLIPYGIDAPKKVKFAALHPAYYPRIVAYSLLLIGVLTSISALSSRAVEAQDVAANNNSNRKRLWVMVVLGVLSAAIFFLLPTLGFPLTTGLALMVAMPLAGERRWWLVLIIALTLPMLLYLFFTQVANIPIPGGLLDPWLLKLN